MAPVLAPHAPQGFDAQQPFEHEALDHPTVILHPMGMPMLWPCLGAQMVPTWNQNLMEPCSCEPESAVSPAPPMCQNAPNGPGMGCSATRRRRERRLRRKLSLALSAPAQTILRAAKPAEKNGCAACELLNSEHSAQKECEDDPSVANPAVLDVDNLPHVSELVANAKLSNTVVDQLDTADRASRAQILRWLEPVTLELALAPSSCRVVQKAVEVAERDDRTALVNHLRGHVVHMLESPHGNHVLQKCIEVMPAGTMQFVLDELLSYPGGWAFLAQHRFGCRVEERIIEHFPEEITKHLITAVLAHAPKLCRHPFGNYVVQHVLEYSSQPLRAEMVSALLSQDIISLAQDQIASNVVARAVELCGPESQKAIAQTIMSVPSGLLSIACSRYGSHTVRKLLDVLQAPIRDQAVHELSSGLVQLRSSRQGRLIAERLV